MRFLIFICVCITLMCCEKETYDDRINQAIERFQPDCNLGIIDSNALVSCTFDGIDWCLTDYQISISHRYTYQELHSGPDTFPNLGNLLSIDLLPINDTGVSPFMVFTFPADTSKLSFVEMVEKHFQPAILEVGKKNFLESFQSVQAALTLPLDSNAVNVHDWNETFNLSTHGIQGNEFGYFEITALDKTEVGDEYEYIFTANFQFNLGFSEHNKRVDPDLRKRVFPVRNGRIRLVFRMPKDG